MSAADREQCLCQVYKSLKEAGIYLFVDQRQGFDRVPAALLERLGDTQLVTTLALTPERRLARGDASQVMAALEAQGFYLQLPPPQVFSQDADMDAMRGKNTKLLR